MPDSAGEPFPPYGGPSDPPADLVVGMNMVVFRIVHGDDPDSEDYRDSFKSHAELGIPPRGREVEAPQIYEGISVYEALEAGIETALRWPKIGDHVARLELAGGIGIRVLRWGPPGHLTVWGDPLMLSLTTTDIVPVQAP